jgi:hypothetical protein|tara:strand:- start:780 stop:920 length:141 start_codon:yes stop_codon:yes gene_type:complete
MSGEYTTAPRTVEDVYDNFSARRDGLIKALTSGTRKRSQSPGVGSH